MNKGISRHHQKPALHEPETVLLAGGSGYVGRAVARLLVERGHRVMVATRSPMRTTQQLGFPQHKRLAVVRLYSKHLPWKPTAVINLCGENIGQRRWSKKRKQALLDSRVKTSQYLISQCFHQWREVKTFINTSAIGYYGDSGQFWLDEDSAAGSGFAAELCGHWEATTDVLPNKVRTATVRLGVVIGPARRGSALGKMLPLYKLGLGGTIGNGNHWMSWIHRDDAARLFAFLLENKHCEGSYNGCAPFPIKYRELNKRLSVQTKRPAIFRSPAWLLKLLLGEMSALLLASQRVTPKRTHQDGFRFLYSNFAAAVAQSVSAPTLTPLRPASKPRPIPAPRSSNRLGGVLTLVPKLATQTVPASEARATKQAANHTPHR